MKPEAFVKAYYQYAKSVEQQTGISAVFILSHGAYESGWNEHAVGNNFFGIKADKNWTGKKQLITTTEYFKDDKHTFPQIISITFIPEKKLYKYRVKAYFRSYDTAEGSFRDHAKFFETNKRYAEALKVKSDPYKFAEAITKAKYATSPTYLETLTSIIRRIEGIVNTQAYGKPL